VLVLLAGAEDAQAQVSDRQGARAHHGEGTYRIHEAPAERAHAQPYEPAEVYDVTSRAKRRLIASFRDQIESIRDQNRDVSRSVQRVFDNQVIALVGCRLCKSKRGQRCVKPSGQARSSHAERVSDSKR
jgi:nitric oxide reductase activation protein